MASTQEKARVVLWFAEYKSIVAVQRRFRKEFGRQAPDPKSIRKWHDTFLATGSINKRHGGGRRVSEEAAEQIRQAFHVSPRKSIRRASRELNMPRTTVHRVVHRRLRLYAYKIQILQELKPNDKPARVEFANTIFNRLNIDPSFLSSTFFSDEATFHLSGKVNRHNSRIWGSENPHVVMEHMRDSPKLNVWCALTETQIIGPFFFAEATITGSVYLDLLEQFFLPQIEHLLPNVHFQQDGAPPHWHKDVRNTLDQVFPGHWIGRGGPIPWPPRSPDLTPLDFFLWGYVKDKVYTSKVRDLLDLRERICTAIASVTPEMLQRTWQELLFRLDVVSATGGAHVECH